MPFPLTMFCCGCPISFGTNLILFTHLAVLLFFVATAFMNIVLHEPTFNKNVDYSTQLWMAGFSLCGIPIILSAAYGVMMRMETNVRLYLYYLFLSFAVNLVASIRERTRIDPCDTSGSLTKFLGDHWGEAYLCGLTRIASYGFGTVMIICEAYALWVVWSFCEEAYNSKGGPELSDLLDGKEDIIQARSEGKEGPYAGIVGLAHSKLPGPYPSVYGTLRTEGMPGQGTIFGGVRHETRYPPPPQAVL
eukprot:gnl/TRDRNA2_/TRDRNA2_180048_c0_seq1.p2 gnl/TRDRNA2_/TRDRNA2_180048_c0~~gnl/TRDRNA2_/TRDRNA2_180048_c0_seq1.p2  ORF type:complete len:248 (+),score=30.00 gnl/TRDRNA2_/TRDRNA2_180048_c0_seq1:67-810(+)